MLAVGCVDGRTRVYACDFTNEGAVTFEACGVLDGHADWVRGVAFAPTRRDDAVFLATASQDRTARVWRVQTVPADGARASKDAACASALRLGHVDVVLVGPQYASNVGSCLRLAACFELGHLRLVAPEYDREADATYERRFAGVGARISALDASSYM